MYGCYFCLRKENGTFSGVREFQSADPGEKRNPGAEAFQEACKLLSLIPFPVCATVHASLCSSGEQGAVGDGHE